MPCGGPAQSGLFKSPWHAYLFLADIVMQRVHIDLSNIEDINTRKAHAALCDVQLATNENVNLHEQVDEMARIIADLNKQLEARAQAKFVLAEAV